MTSEKVDGSDMQPTTALLEIICDYLRNAHLVQNQMLSVVGRKQVALRLLWSGTPSLCAHFFARRFSTALIARSKRSDASKQHDVIDPRTAMSIDDAPTK